MPVAQLNLAEVWPGADDWQITFASESVVGLIGVHSGDLESRMLVSVDCSYGKLRLEKSTPIQPYPLADLYGLSGGLFLLHSPNVQLRSRDLQVIANVPIHVLLPPSLRGSLAGDLEGQQGWRLYRLGQQASFVRSGEGELLAASNEFLVLRSDRQLRIMDAVTGLIAGGFSVPSRASGCAERVTALGPDRLLMTDCKNDRVVNFKGEPLTKLPPREGWGFRHEASADGSRVVFDDFTRKLTTWQRSVETIRSFLTLGMGPSVSSVGEDIRVVDTRNGATCLRIESPGRQMGRAGHYHADISPSGRFAAVVDGNLLSLYALPAECDVSK